MPQKWKELTANGLDTDL